MATGSNKTIFGIHSITAYDINTKEIYGQSLITGNLSMNPNAEIIELNGGSSAFAWDTEQGQASSEVSLTLREIPNWFYKAMYGVDVTVNAAEAGGAISEALANANGTTVQGIAGVDSVAISTAGDVKSGKYTVVAASATTVDVYVSSNIDFGGAVTFVDGANKVNATPLTITAGGNTTLAGFGIDLVGGAGPIAMTPGETAFFEVRGINNGSEKVTVGASGVVSPQFGLYAYAQKRGTGEIFNLDIFRCKAYGFPINLTEKEFAEFEVTLTMSYDCDRDGIFNQERLF